MQPHMTTKSLWLYIHAQFSYHFSSHWRTQYKPWIIPVTKLITWYIYITIINWFRFIISDSIYFIFFSLILISIQLIVFKFQCQLCIYSLFSQHYSDVIMRTMASQTPTFPLFTQPFIQAQSKKTSKPRHWPLWGIHRWPVNSPHKVPVTRNMFPFDDVIMIKPIRKLRCTTTDNSCVLAICCIILSYQNPIMRYLITPLQSTYCHYFVIWSNMWARMRRTVKTLFLPVPILRHKMVQI